MRRGPAVAGATLQLPISRSMSATGKRQRQQATPKQHSAPRLCLFARNRRVVLQKLIQTVTRFERIEQILKRNPRAHEHGGSALNFGIAMYYDLAHLLPPIRSVIVGSGVERPVRLQPSRGVSCTRGAGGPRSVARAAVAGAAVAGAACGIGLPGPNCATSEHRGVEHEPGPNAVAAGRNHIQFH